MSKDVKPFSSCGGLMGNITLNGNTPSIAIDERVYGVNDLFVSSYLVYAGDDASGQREFIAMDTGNDPDNLLTSLESYNINPDQVKAVFLSHSHGDHTGGLVVFPHAKVYISQQEKDFACSGPNEEIDLTHDELSNFENVTDGKKIKINEITIEVIESPGHTPGSVSYLVDGRYLFAGATLNIDYNQKAEHQAITLNENHDQCKKSNLKLANLVIENKIEMVFTTHGSYTAAPRLAFSDWIASP